MNPASIEDSTMKSPPATREMKRFINASLELLSAYALGRELSASSLVTLKNALNVEILSIRTGEDIEGKRQVVQEGHPWLMEGPLRITVPLIREAAELLREYFRLTN